MSGRPKPELDEPLYRCLKKMEHTAQGMIFELPQPESEAYMAMRIDAAEAWKMGSLISALIWFRDRVTAASNRVYLESRPELKEEQRNE
jgi:hypothetical protein